MGDAKIHPDLTHLAHPVEGLDPLPGNPRLGDVEAVARSYARFGQRKPIVARREGERAVVLAGNHQLAAARQLGWDRIAVVWTDDDDATAKAYALADNQTGLLGGYDTDALAALLHDVNDTADLELLAATGFDDAEVERLLRSLEPKEGLGDPDDAPPVPATPVTKPGDLWLLGPHRVLCGDSTEPGAFAAVLDGGQADMVWTDPPYGVSYQTNMTVADAKRRNRRKDGLEVSNDTLTGDALRDLLRTSLGATFDGARPGACYFIASPSGERLLDFAAVLGEMGLLRHTIIWAKDAFVFGRSDYHYRHETIFYGWKAGAPHQPTADRAQDTVWEIPRPRRSAEHPTMKPVALIARAIENHTDPGDLVLDPFGGSGSTLIAANDLQRVARLIELDPRYVDVICHRYQAHTGDLPILAATGEPHDFTREPA